jgi:hypothetical protein
MSGVNEQPERRMARNESMFREVNEAIENGRWPGEDDAPVAFCCECANLGCGQLIELSLRDYERVRANPRRFIVAVDHHAPGVEAIAEAFERYLVVEKTGEAGRVAEATDPRR